jgi:hypothetical protein
MRRRARAGGFCRALAGPAVATAASAGRVGGAGGGGGVPVAAGRRRRPLPGGADGGGRVPVPAASRWSRLPGPGRLGRAAVADGASRRRPKPGPGRLGRAPATTVRVHSRTPRWATAQKPPLRNGSRPLDGTPRASVQKPLPYSGSRPLATAPVRECTETGAPPGAGERRRGLVAAAGACHRAAPRGNRNATPAGAAPRRRFHSPSRCAHGGRPVAHAAPRRRGTAAPRMCRRAASTPFPRPPARCWRV